MGCLRVGLVGRIAQVVEQLTLNQRVVGSSPTAPTKILKDLARVSQASPLRQVTCKVTLAYPMEGSMLHSRRDILKSSAAATAAAGLLAAGKLTATEDDAELVKLWEDWKAQWDAWGVSSKAESAAEEAAWGEEAPCWRRVEGLGCYLTPDMPFSATYVHFVNGEAHYQTMKLEGAETLQAAYAAAKARDGEFKAAYERSKKAARRKYRLGALERAEHLACRRLGEIASQIADAPAHGVAGLAVKLALAKREHDFMQEPAVSLVASCYELASKMAGRDFAAEVVQW